MGVLDRVQKLKSQDKAVKKVNFFATIPGILTGIAMIITAIAGLITAYQSHNKTIIDRLDKVEQTCSDNKKQVERLKQDYVRRIR